MNFRSPSFTREIKVMPEIEIARTGAEPLQGSGRPTWQQTIWPEVRRKLITSRITNFLDELLAGAWSFGICVHHPLGKGFG